MDQKAREAVEKVDSCRDGSKRKLEGAYENVDEWNDSIDASKAEGAVRRIEVEEVRCAVNHMKIGKARGPSGVAIELFKASGDKCLKSLANI